MPYNHIMCGVDDDGDNGDKNRDWHNLQCNQLELNSMMIHFLNGAHTGHICVDMLIKCAHCAYALARRARMYPAARTHKSTDSPAHFTCARLQPR